MDSQRKQLRPHFYDIRQQKPGPTESSQKRWNAIFEDQCVPKVYLEVSQSKNYIQVYSNTTFACIHNIYGLGKFVDKTNRYFSSCKFGPDCTSTNCRYWHLSTRYFSSEKACKKICKIFKTHKCNEHTIRLLTLLLCDILKNCEYKHIQVITFYDFTMCLKATFNEFTLCEAIRDYINYGPQVGPYPLTKSEMLAIGQHVFKLLNFFYSGQPAINKKS
jgi:hypothetical protein